MFHPITLKIRGKIGGKNMNKKLFILVGEWKQHNCSVARDKDMWRDGDRPISDAYRPISDAYVRVELLFMFNVFHEFSEISFYDYHFSPISKMTLVCQLSSLKFRPSQTKTVVHFFSSNFMISFQSYFVVIREKTAKPQT